MTRRKYVLHESATDRTKSDLIRSNLEKYPKSKSITTRVKVSTICL